MTPGPTRRLPGWIGNLLLMIVSSLFALAAFETFLIYDDWHPRSSDYSSQVTLAGNTYRFFETVEAINAADTAVIIAGDSFTAGSSCSDGKTYPTAFTRAARRAGADLHGVNMGVQGTGPISYMSRVKSYLADKGTAAGVIMTLYANDIEIDCEACRALETWSRRGGLTDADRERLQQFCRSCQSTTQKVSGTVSLSRRLNWWLSDRLHSYQILREGAAKVASTLGLLPAAWGRGAFPDQWRNQEGVAFKHVQAAIELVRDETAAKSVPFMVLIYPDPVAISRENPYWQIYEATSATLRKATGVPVLSGYDAFLNDPRTVPNMAFSLTDTHPSCEAHEIFGDWAFRQWQTLGSRGLPARR